MSRHTVTQNHEVRDVSKCLVVQMWYERRRVTPRPRGQLELASATDLWRTNRLKKIFENADFRESCRAAELGESARRRACGAAQIPAPEGSTEETRFTCRRCCAKIQRERNKRSRPTFKGSEIENPKMKDGRDGLSRHQTPPRLTVSTVRKKRPSRQWRV